MALATKNAFELLQKGKDKEKPKKSERVDKAADAARLEAAIFSQPSAGVSNWADDDDDDFSVPQLPPDWAEVWARPARGRPRGGDRRGGADCWGARPLAHAVDRTLGAPDGGWRARGRAAPAARPRARPTTRAGPRDHTCPLAPARYHP